MSCAHTCKYQNPAQQTRTSFILYSFNIILRNPSVLTSRLLCHITNCCGPLIVAIKATPIHAGARDARSDCCSLCRTDCSFSGLKCPNCNAPWQTSVWSTASVPSHCSPRLQEVGMLRFVKLSTPARAWTKARIVYIDLNGYFNRATKLHI